MSKSPDLQQVMARKCPHCEGPIREGVLGGLCPRCLLSGSLERKADNEFSACIPQFAGYELLEKLGEGGMGVVYKARQLKGIRRVVALKRLRDGELAGASARRRFLLEARAAAELRHAHIVPIYEVGEHEGEPYFTMELLSGGTLAHHSARYKKARRAAALVKKLARAVHAGHSKSILHRDLKPANILLDAQGKPHIADFGVAKRLGEKGSTQTGAFVGTIEYMAPEQSSPHGHRDSPAADVWSLGVILYELLAGRRPFSAPTAVEVIRAVNEEDPIPLERLRPGIDRDLATICYTCLQKDPKQRYISADALASELGRYLRGEPILARRPGFLTRAAYLCRLHPVLVALFSAATLSLIGLSAWALVSSREQEKARRGEVLTANMFAARAIAGTVLAQIREYADIIAEEAGDPRLAEAIMRNDDAQVQALCDAARERHAFVHPSWDLWFVTDADGYVRAYAPIPIHGRSWFQNYSFRDYFRAVKALSTGVSHPVYISRAVRSTTDDRYKVVIASPIRDTMGAFVGLIAVSIPTDRRLGGLALSDERRIAVLTVRRDRDLAADPLPDEHILLVHDGVANGDGIVVENEALHRLSARRDAARIPLQDRLRLPSPDWVEAQDDYIDEMDEANSRGERRRWLAGVAPVGATELSVIVQTRVEDATALDETPFRVLAAWSLGSTVLLGAGIVAASWARRKRRSAAEKSAVNQ